MHELLIRPTLSKTKCFPNDITAVEVEIQLKPHRNTERVPLTTF
jgi:hypothetical protein